jgi:hypothetical protein
MPGEGLLLPTWSAVFSFVLFDLSVVGCWLLKVDVNYRCL